MLIMAEKALMDKISNLQASSQVHSYHIYCITGLFGVVFNLAFLANASQRQIKYHIKICLHKDGIVLTAPDAKINTGKIIF